MRTAVVFIIGLAIGASGTWLYMYRTVDLAAARFELAMLVEELRPIHRYLSRYDEEPPCQIIWDAHIAAGELKAMIERSILSNEDPSVVSAIALLRQHETRYGIAEPECNPVHETN